LKFYRFWNEPESELGKLQASVLGECLKLISNTLQSPSFRQTSGLNALEQDPIIIRKLQNFLESLNSFKLAGTILNSSQSFNLLAFFEICNHSKSAIVAWALSKRILSTKRCTEISLLEQSFQASKWGKCREYHDLKEAELLKKLSCAALFFAK